MTSQAVPDTHGGRFQAEGHELSTELDVIVRFFSPQKGGRAVLPNFVDGQYRPHLVLDADDAGTYLGVHFLAGAEGLAFDVDVLATLRLPYENVDYSGLTPGATFQIMEGRNHVGQGSVL